jgi:Ser/Thr protein kinase RdoA (MazF antagonist)
MKNETFIDKEKLIRSIHQDYGLEIVNLEFLLRGFGGDCYRAVTRSGESYFLKLHDPVANQMLAASSRAFYLPLMHQLYTKTILPNIPHPLPTLDGNLSLKIEANELVITNFIEGELVGFGELPLSILAQLAEQVGILHRSRTQLEFEHPFSDQFDIVFEHDLLKSFNTLASLPETASPGQKLLRDTILPYEDQITAGLKRLKELHTYARSVNKPQVICHTDLHGSNLMTDNQGNLYILDWENALIAPLEHDMIFFAGEEGFFDVFWPTYTRKFPTASIDFDVLRFYFYRRSLEDIADFILRILRRDGSPDRDQQDIVWMLECLDDLGQIENTISTLEKGFASL